MIPVKLKIEGFLSYRQPVELDFTGFDLACISGPNGAGKSSLLDAITWVLFGQARQRDESVINNHPAVKAATVTLDFDYEGNRYRVQRTNPRGKTSTVEFFILSHVADEDGRWKPLTERTLRETDQKILAGDGSKDSGYLANGLRHLHQRLLFPAGQGGSICDCPAGGAQANPQQHPWIGGLGDLPRRSPSTAHPKGKGSS